MAGYSPDEDCNYCWVATAEMTGDEKEEMKSSLCMASQNAMRWLVNSDSAQLMSVRGRRTPPRLTWRVVAAH
jgi:hypothetical protein